MSTVSAPVYLCHLHSNMFLLRRFCSLGDRILKIHLHSNMFLLRRTLAISEAYCLLYLHSNMFLLRLSAVWENERLGRNLHSNMFLLRLNLSRLRRMGKAAFTFQYVSIKTRLYLPKNRSLNYLHSNMFLLRHCLYIAINN